MATQHITHNVRNPLKQNEWIELWTATTTATSTATGSTAATYKIEPSKNWDIPSNQIKGDISEDQIKITSTPGVVITGDDDDGHITTLPFSSSTAVYLNGQGQWTTPQTDISITGTNGIGVTSNNNTWSIGHNFTTSTPAAVDEETGLYWAPEIPTDELAIYPNFVSQVIIPYLEYNIQGHILNSVGQPKNIGNTLYVEKGILS